MHRPSRLFVVCFFLVCTAFSTPVWASGSPVVYVSSGGTILSVPTAGGAATTLVSNGAASYEGLVVGPDNADSNSPGYLLYACDPSHNTVIRFDPNNAPAKGGPAAETVYKGAGQAGTLQQPQCGRFDSSGDLVLTSKVAGSGFWVIDGVTGIGFGKGGFSAPKQNAGAAAFSATQVTEGVAQKNIGDLLIVDSANGKVIRSAYTSTALGPPFDDPKSPSCLIGPAKSGCTNTTAAIPAPFGIAKTSVGAIFVSNQSKRVNNIVEFNAQGGGASTCVTFNKPIPFFMQMSADDTLYVATTSNNSGAVYSVNTGTCTATAVNSALPPLVGIALPPTTASITVDNLSGTETFNFGFAAYQLTSPAPGCTSPVTVTAIPTNLAVVESVIAADAVDFPFGGTPAVNLGWDDFEIVLQVDGANSCTPQFVDGTFIPLQAAQLDNLLANNPRTVRCDDAPPSTAGCTTGTVWADYPLGGVLPSDGTYGGKVPGGSTHYVVNGNMSNLEPGQFCGFGPPMSNTPPPGIAGVFGSGQNLSLKFTLAKAGGNCQNGPFITDASALISIAQIFDSKGNPVFVPNVAINASGNSTPPPQPVFKNDPQKKQYQFSLSLQGYAKGIYSLTITFLSNNTTYQVAEIQIN